MTDSLSSRKTAPHVRAAFDPATNTISYIVHDPATKAAAIIDPVLDFTPRNGRTRTTSADLLLEAVRNDGLDLRYLLETHAHADHLSASHYLRERTGAPVVIGEHITDVQAIFADLFEADDVARDGRAFDRLVREGDTLPLGSMEIRVLHTPGHTPACVSYLIGDAAFVGDTLFMPDFGTARCDFPGGSAETMFDSVQRILSLPDDTRIFVGHDYKAPGRDVYAWESTVGAQKALNVHIGAGRSKAEFVALRQKRDATLAMPRLIVPSLQVNMRAGQMPEPEDNGLSYLKVPINGL